MVQSASARTQGKGRRDSWRESEKRRVSVVIISNGSKLLPVSRYYIFKYYIISSWLNQFPSSARGGRLRWKGGRRLGSWRWPLAFRGISVIRWESSAPRWARRRWLDCRTHGWSTKSESDFVECSSRALAERDCCKVATDLDSADRQTLWGLACKHDKYWVSDELIKRRFNRTYFVASISSFLLKISESVWLRFKYSAICLDGNSVSHTYRKSRAKWIASPKNKWKIMF